MPRQIALSEMGIIGHNTGREVGHNTPTCVPALLWQVSQSPSIPKSIKRKVLGHPSLVSAARFAVGLPTSKTFGRVTVGTHGARSIREACARHACINGLRHSASDADSGHYILIGMYIDGTGEERHVSVFPIRLRMNSGGLPLTGRSGSQKRFDVSV